MRVAKIEEKAKLPTRKNKTDAGLDLYPLHEFIQIEPNIIAVVRTGITVEIPKGCFGWITNKSKSDFLIGGGIVDEGYQGELLIKVFNINDTPIILSRDKAIAQLLIIPVIISAVEEVSKDSIHIDKTDRGSDGGIVKQVEVRPGLRYKNGILE